MREARSVPASGSVYPMANSRSPRRILGRNSCFCSAEPNFMIVGATEWSVRTGNGARRAQMVS